MTGGGRCTIVGPLLMMVGGTTLAWQEFKSQLVPHDGSQKSPGHQFSPGGCAWASGTPPRPVNPNAAAVAADAIAQLVNLLMRLSIRGEAMRQPSDPCWPDENAARSGLTGRTPKEVTALQFCCAD